MIITIDGTAGTGKTTVAKRVAEKLGVTYFDTGAMYRAVTWGLLNAGVDLKDTAQVDAYLKEFSFDIHKRSGDKRYLVGQTDVTEAIRTQEITECVSEVSAMPNVRKALWKMQRAYAEKQSAVFEGRDMGSVVFPKAEVKVFLDADPKERARRRLNEMRQKLPEEAALFDEEKMVQELARRDTYDRTRKVAPLKCPKGAYRIDTTSLQIDEVVENIIKYHHEKAEELLPAWLHSQKMRLIYRVIIFFAWLFFKVFYRHKVYGLEHFVKRAAIIAPNHTSYYDPPLTAASWPEEVHFLARESLFKPFMFGSFIRALNSHPVSGDFADVSIFKIILKLLKEGKQIILFPEGGRSDGELEKIKPGIGMLLMRSQAVIVPTYIHGAFQVWSRNRKLPKPFGKTACVFGSPLMWESFAHLEKREAQEAIAARLSKSILALKAWYEAGAEGTPP